MKNDKTESEIIDVTSNCGTLYHPKSALVFYQITILKLMWNFSTWIRTEIRSTLIL